MLLLWPLPRPPGQQSTAPQPSQHYLQLIGAGLCLVQALS